MDKESRKSVSGLVSKLGVTIQIGLSNNQGTITLSITGAEYVEILPCAQELNFVNMLLEKINEV